MFNSVPLVLILLVVVCATISSYTTRDPNRKKQNKDIRVESIYQSLNAPIEESTTNYQLVSVRKSTRPAHSIFMSVKDQEKRASSVVGYRGYSNEERTQDQGFVPQMTIGSVGYNTLISTTAEVGISDELCNVGNIKQRSARFANVHRNVKSKPKSLEKKLRCGPCCCHHREKFISANCAQRNLTAVPGRLPPNIRTLNMSLNSVNTLNKTSFLQYPNLTDLDFTGCLISQIYDDSFAVLHKLTSLTLKDNKLTYLSKYTFTGLECLQTLDLSNNKISKIEIGAFDTLQHLKILTLSWNRHLGYSNETFSSLLLMKLKRLETLCIHGNTDGMENSYPNKALQPLEALQYLSIDGLAGSVEFGREMKNLAQLVHLEIKGTCKITNISATFFQNVPRIQFLLIKDCDVQNIHPEAFAIIRQLQNLNLSFLKYLSITSAFQALVSLNNSGLKSLTFKNLRRFVNTCTYLNIDHAKYITNINLHELDLSQNNIAVLKKNFFLGLPRTLERLFLNGNKFAFATGNHTWDMYSVLKEITYFDLSMQNHNEFFNYRHGNVADDSSVAQCEDTEHLERKEDKIISYEKRDNFVPMHGYLDNVKENSHCENRAMCCRPSGIDTCEILHQRMYLNFPPNLKTLKASHYQGFGMTVLANDLPEDNSLHEIDFSNSFLSKWGSGILPRKIVLANLGENYCRCICTGFFQPNNLHEHLYLHDNILGSQFANDENGSIFAELTQTSDLDISRNLIYRLPRQFFKGLFNLKRLKISENRIQHLDVSLKHMTQLLYIDLSRNAIQSISKKTRNDLDTIATDHNFTIDITNNPLPCTCAGLDIIIWMATTKVYFLNANNLTCDSDESTSELIGDLEMKSSALQRFCMYKAVYIIGCVAVTAVVIISVVLGFMYRYRWKLRYFHNIAIAAVFGFKPDILPKSGCTFDAYFVYTKETQDFVVNACIKELELKRGHRLCVEDRDFLAGTYTVSNIVSAVRNSTKTVPVMTPTFYNGVYSEYSFKMAVMEELYKNRCVLHLLLYKPIPTEQMSHDELKVMKRNSYIEYPPEEATDENIRLKFWDDLSLAIGHTDNQTQQLPNMQ